MRIRILCLMGLATLMAGTLAAQVRGPQAVRALLQPVRTAA